MTILKHHVYKLYRSSRCAHRDESGTEAVEWIAVGAALFMFALALSVVLDGNGTQLGQALTGRVEMTVGKWNSGRSANTSTLTQVTVANDSVDQSASSQSASSQSTQGDSASGQNGARVADSASGSTSGNNSRSTINTSASFSGSGANLEAESSNQSSNKPDSSAPNAQTSKRGNLIISDNTQVRQNVTGGGADDTQEDKRTRGPFGEVWEQIERRVRPVTDAINRAFASMFREK